MIVKDKYTLEEVYEDIESQIDADYGAMSLKEFRDMSVVGLAEEAGEVCGILKREHRMKFRDNPKDAEKVKLEHVIEELGDVLWYLTAVCHAYGFSLDEIYRNNCIKLNERYGEQAYGSDKI